MNNPSVTIPNDSWQIPIGKPFKKEDFPEISALYEARGFTRIADEGDGEWHSGLYRKNEGDPV